MKKKKHYRIRQDGLVLGGGGRKQWTNDGKKGYKERVRSPRGNRKNLKVRGDFGEGGAAFRTGEIKEASQM